MLSQRVNGCVSKGTLPLLALDNGKSNVSEMLYAYAQPLNVQGDLLVTIVNSHIQ